MSTKRACTTGRHRCQQTWQGELVALSIYPNPARLCDFNHLGSAPIVIGLPLPCGAPNSLQQASGMACITAVLFAAAGTRISNSSSRNAFVSFLSEQSNTTAFVANDSISFCGAHKSLFAHPFPNCVRYPSLDDIGKTIELTASGSRRAQSTAGAGAATRSVLRNSAISTPRLSCFSWREIGPGYG